MLDPYPPQYRTGWPETLVQDFANWGREPEDILRFTRRFGPLNRSAQGGRPFTVKVSEWLRRQDAFREEWDDVALRLKPGSAVPLWTGTELEVVSGERFEFVSDAYTYVAATLERLLLLELRCVDRGRLRTCARPDCPNPYFVAAHLKQTYCSPPCAQWGQGEAKRRWWREKGDTERRRRTAQAKKGRAKR